MSTITRKSINQIILRNLPEPKKRFTLERAAEETKKLMLMAKDMAIAELKQKVINKGYKAYVFSEFSPAIYQKRRINSKKEFEEQILPLLDFTVNVFDQKGKRLLRTFENVLSDDSRFLEFLNGP